jgi:hypothetical protein
MKMEISLVILFCLCYFTQSEDIIYNVSKVFKFLDLDGLENDEYETILQNISKIFENSYAFYDIAKKPPQPSFNKSYHKTVDLQERFKNLNVKDINTYEFYQKIRNVLADLKDPHIALYFKDSYIEDFNILSPFMYYIQEYNGKQRIFASCISQSYLKYFKDYAKVYEFCVTFNDLPIKTINEKDPFEYISNFGGNYLSTKNNHGTFTFKLNYNNDIPLSDYPLTEKELEQLNIVFEDDEDKEESITVNTEYKIHSSTINIDKEIEENQEALRRLGEGRRVRSKYYSINRKNMEKDKEKREKKRNKKSKFFEENQSKRNLEEEFTWTYNAEDIFMCTVDETNKINFYYVESFEPSDRNNFKEIIKKCVELFDKNAYPIVVVNELNNGGYISLAQLFMGLLSPLMPIDLFKGRLRATESLKDNNEVNNYINSNLTSTNTCQKQTFADLLKDSVKPNYCENKLSQMFYLNNVTLHDEIENIRKNMKNKRKPTDILILTDGYSYSASAFYIKYLQKMGGAIVAGYFGNPYSTDEFDSSQSPSPIFIAGLLNVFNANENKKLYEKYGIILEFPGIQSFYSLDDKDVPLEYDVTPVDIRLDLYSTFNQNSFQNFTKSSKTILNDIKNKCFAANKNLIMFSDECDKSFKNNYTHGGFTCNEKGEWTKECVAAYCELGYSFDQKNKKCIKDVCSSIPIPDIKNDDEQGAPSNEKESETETEVKSSGALIFIIVVIILFLILIAALVVIFVRKKRLHSKNVEFNKEINDIVV